MSDNPYMRSHGFRLVDLLAVLGIGFIIIMLVLPLLHKTRTDDGYSQCEMNLKQIGIGFHNYADVFGRRLPPLSGAPLYTGGTYPQSILFTLLPFIEDVTLYQAGLEEQNGHTWAGTVSGAPLFRSGIVKTYLCYMDSSCLPSGLVPQYQWAASSYAANAQVFGSGPRLVPDPRPGGKSWNELASEFHIDAIPDGTSNTIFFCERLALAGPSNGATPCAWANPPAGGVGLGNTIKDALGCPLQTFVTRHGMIRASVCGPAVFFGCGTQEDPVGAVAGDNAVVPMYPLPEIGVKPLLASTDGRAQSSHADFIYVGMGDGSVRYVSAHVSQATWARAISPDDGLPLGGDW
jgi:hypothetical protein